MHNRGPVPYRQVVQSVLQQLPETKLIPQEVEMAVRDLTLANNQLREELDDLWDLVNFMGQNPGMGVVEWGRYRKVRQMFREVV